MRGRWRKKAGIALTIAILATALLFRGWRDDGTDRSVDVPLRGKDDPAKRERRGESVPNSVESTGYSQQKSPVVRPETAQREPKESGSVEEKGAAIAASGALVKEKMGYPAAGSAVAASPPAASGDTHHEVNAEGLTAQKTPPAQNGDSAVPTPPVSVAVEHKQETRPQKNVPPANDAAWKTAIEEMAVKKEEELLIAAKRTEVSGEPPTNGSGGDDDGQKSSDIQKDAPAAVANAGETVAPLAAPASAAKAETASVSGTPADAASGHEGPTDIESDRPAISGNKAGAQVPGAAQPDIQNDHSAFAAPSLTSDAPSMPHPAGKPLAAYTTELAPQSGTQKDAISEKVVEEFLSVKAGEADAQNHRVPASLPPQPSPSEAEPLPVQPPNALVAAAASDENGKNTSSPPASGVAAPSSPAAGTGTAANPSPAATPAAPIISALPAGGQRVPTPSQPVRKDQVAVVQPQSPVPADRKEAAEKGEAVGQTAPALPSQPAEGLSEAEQALFDRFGGDWEGPECFKNEREALVYYRILMKGNAESIRWYRNYRFTQSERARRRVYGLDIVTALAAMNPQRPLWPRLLTDTVKKKWDCPETLAGAARLAGSSGNRKLVPLLRQMLDHEAAFVEIEAAGALLALDDHETALPVLEKMVQEGKTAALGQIHRNLRGKVWQGRGLGILRRAQDSRHNETRALATLFMISLRNSGLAKDDPKKLEESLAAIGEEIVERNRLIASFYRDSDHRTLEIVIRGFDELRSRESLPLLRRIADHPEASYLKARVLAVIKKLQ